jgi:hypothetical protein
VFYELGIAHSCKIALKVVIISQSLEDIPFDLRHMRCITYKNDPAGLRSLSKDLQRALLSDSKDVYRFEALEERPFVFRERLSGKNRNFYTFTINHLHVGNGAAKFAITVHRESLDEGNATLKPDYNYVEIGGYAPITATDWRLRLERTSKNRAFFTVERTTVKKGAL